MGSEDEGRPGAQQLSIADVGMVLGAFVGAIDRYHQFCNKIAKAVTVVGRDFNCGAERGFSGVAGAHRLDEIAEEARQRRDTEQHVPQTESTEAADLRTPPRQVVTATVACSRHAVVKRTLQRAVRDGRLQDFREDNRARGMPLLVDLNEVAKLWPERGATK